MTPPRVRVVLEREGHPPFSFEAPEGEALQDACDDARAPVSFSCRSATCGTCVLRVIEGGNFFSAVTEAEREVLDDLGYDIATHRLACTAKIAGASASGESIVRATPLNAPQDPSDL